MTFDPASLRPADGGAKALQAALDQARAAAPLVEAELATKRQTRDDLLLDGSPSDLAAAEAALAKARATGEKVAAMLNQLERRLGEARKAEVIGGVLAKVKAEAEAHAALAKWWKAEKKRLLSTITTGLQLTTTVWDRGQELSWAAMEAAQQYPDFVKPLVNADSSISEWASRLRTVLSYPEERDGPDRLLTLGEAPPPSA